MSAPIHQDELTPNDEKISAEFHYDSVEIDAPALQPSLSVAKAPPQQSSPERTINQENVLSVDPLSRMPEVEDNIEYRSVRITAIVSAVAVVVWIGVCVVLALGHLDKNDFVILRNGLTFANDTLGERLQAANAALHKVSRPMLSPTLAALETTGAVNAELPLAIKVTNYTPATAINLSGLAAGTTLSSGIDVGDGQWRIAVDDLPNTRVIPPPEYIGPMTIFVELRNDDDRALVRIPLRLTWRRAVTESTGTVEDSGASPLAAAPVVDDMAKQFVSDGAKQKDVAAAGPQSESRAPISGLIKPNKSQRFAKKRRHKAPSWDPERQTDVDRRTNLPLPVFGDILINAGAAQKREPGWNNDSADIIDRSWERCREPFACSREMRR